MAELEEKKLKDFAKEEHKKYKKQAIAESIVAILPLAALLTGFSIIYSQPNSGELMSPDRLGFASLLFPFLIMAYLVFLFFVGKDIRNRLKRV